MTSFVLDIGCFTIILIMFAVPALFVVSLVKNWSNFLKYWLGAFSAIIFIVAYAFLRSEI